MADSHHTKEALIELYRRTETIAVVGASGDTTKAAHRIPSYLHDQGYRIIPVSPRGGELFGEPVRSSLADITDRIDVVDVFRPRVEATAIGRQAIACGARVLWFQPGTETEEAVQIASGTGMEVVTGRCMGATHAQLRVEPRTSGRAPANGGE